MDVVIANRIHKTKSQKLSKLFTAGEFKKKRHGHPLAMANIEKEREIEML